MKYVLTHYQGDVGWVKEYTDDVIIYNRSDQEIPGSIRRENVGDADYDRLTYLIDNYDDLPEVFLLSKSNLFKYISKEEFDLVKDNRVFTPLLTQHHKVYEPICRYTDGMYEEINNSWYLGAVPARYFRDWSEWAKTFDLPNPEYIPFAPGGNYILTKDVVQRYPKRFYERMRAFLPYTQRPGEAQLVERSYYLLWQ